MNQRIGASIAACEAALKATGPTYKRYGYEGVNPAFANDTSPARYNAGTAKQAWDRTLQLLKRKPG